MPTRSTLSVRGRFDKIYDSCILGAGFFEGDSYYRTERDRYWRSLEVLCTLDLPEHMSVLEVGGGQLALLLSKLFNDHATVADISERYIESVAKQGVSFLQFNLLDQYMPPLAEKFDVIIMLEVIEHLPIPPYKVFEKLQSLLKPRGIIFLTTPNFFRIRNLVRMALGREFLDYFRFAEPEHSLGHVMEYSASHLRWHLEKSGLEVLMLRHDELGRTGHSVSAKFVRKLFTPLRVARKSWRDGLIAAASKRC